MRAFVAPRAGEKIGHKDGNDQPGENDQLDRARRAPRDEISGNRGESDNAAEKTRSDEGTMARCGQRILLCGRMHQHRNIVSYRRQQAHDPNARPNLQTRSPFFWSRIVSEAT